MRKRSFAIFCFVLFVLLPCSLLLAQSDDLVLNNKELGEKGRSPVEFPHGLHMSGELSCTDCHHDYRHGKNVLDESMLTDENYDKIRCAACHGESAEGHNDYDLRDAYHLKCMGCHKKVGKSGKKTGPRLCAQCHPRAK